MFGNIWVSMAFLFCATTCATGFSVTTSNANVQVKENQGTDLTCSNTPDFGAGARLEWKFKDLKGSQTYVVFHGEVTESYASRVTLFNSNLRFSKVTRNDIGEYDCEVSGNGQFGEARVMLVVLVPPSPPICRIPTTITTGSIGILSCHDGDGYPPPTYNWYKDGTLLPANPSQFAAFKNATYKLNATSGHLDFLPATQMDSGEYYCEAFNGAGPAQSCKAVKVEVRDVNTGGIVAAVIIVLLLLIFLGLALWYANKKGYLPKKSESKPKSSGVYQPAASFGGGDENDGEFKQKSSFVV